jgi:hypothetical protein
MIPACAICGDRHLNPCRESDSLMEQLQASVSHQQDSDCTIGIHGLCVVCMVDHSGDPCPDCDGRGFHKPTCYWMSPVMAGLEATL